MSGAEEASDPESELVVVANRLPMEPVSPDDSQAPEASWRRAPGGLVSALDAVLRSRPCTWVGYGEAIQPEQRDGMALQSVLVDDELYADYYTGFCNSAIWPLYHDAIETPDFHRDQFDAYLAVNRIFAERVAEIAGPSARVWVHDYQLQCVPDLLRRLRPDVRIGFFLHIPFPPPELFAQLPWRRQVLEGLLGADLVGFQTAGDTHNFLAACTRFIGAHSEGGKVVLPDRDVRVEAFPVGVDARGFSEVADRADVRQRACTLRSELGNPRTLMLGVDRLDYTKGIDIRLRAFAELMERGGLDPSSTVFVQVAVPTRGEIREYQRARTEVEALVGRINGSLASIGAPAIHYLHRMLDYDELVALYLAADILVVTPLRDGMNLVAKEYVATRNDGTGALILSEFAGAAQQLSASWLVNPYDTVGLEDAMEEAASSSDAERHGRMTALRRSVFEDDAQTWATDFLDALSPEAVEEREPSPPGGDVAVPAAALATAPHLLVCCDYDGTLAPIVDDPTQARPLEESVVALRALSVLPSTTVAVVSGRSLRDLAVMSRLPSEIHLVGSHGWEMDQDFSLDPQQRRLLHQVVNAAVDLADHVPGSYLELKPSSVAVHVRRCTPEAGEELLRALAMGPGQVPGVVVRYGKAVIELGVVKADKADAVAMLRHRVGASAVLFIGDDLTDETVFRTLSGPDVAVKVGDGDSAAPWRVDSPQEVSTLLFDVLQRRERWLLGGHANPIEDHVLLSNQHAVALLSPLGSLDWFCAPDPDSSAVFSGLLGDTSSGHFSIRPRHGANPLSQSYVANTLTARTRWAGLTVLDYLPIPRGDSEATARIIRRISGTEKAVVSFAPRPQFGMVTATIECREGGLVVQGGADPIALHAPGVDWEIREDCGAHSAVAVIDLSAGPVVLDLRFGTADLTPDAEPEPLMRSRTEQHWQDWVAGLTLPGVRPDHEARSALTLRALCHRPTGGILAAATSSLPERLGGVRNWDYRYCWLRDGAMTARELLAVGSTEDARAFIDWMHRLSEGSGSAERLHPVYTLQGQPLGPEGIVDTLPGYAGSRPVRVGNAAQGQLQLDVFGAVVALIDEYSEFRGEVTDTDWEVTEALLDAVAMRWREPDHGIWEIRHQPRLHTHSRMMCWVAADRGSRIAQRRGKIRPEWEALRDEIERDIEAHAWDDSVGAYIAAYDFPEADAAVLQGILEGYPAPAERIEGTIGFIERELRRGGGVYRYTYDDGLPSGEGAMHICAAWLAAMYLRADAMDDAAQMLNAILASAGATGLLPEQVDPIGERGLGNHPQAYSHIGVLSVARHMAQTLAPTPRR